MTESLTFCYPTSGLRNSREPGSAAPRKTKSRMAGKTKNYKQ